MDRRRFLIHMGGAVASVSLGGCAGQLLSTDERGMGLASTDTDLAALANPRFSGLAAGANRQVLYRQLMARGVIAEDGRVSQSTLQALAEREPVVIYREFYYTRTELDLYTLAYLSHPTGLGL